MPVQKAPENFFTADGSGKLMSVPTMAVGRMLSGISLPSKMGLFPYSFDELLFMKRRLYKKSNELWVPSEDTQPYFWRPSSYPLEGTYGYARGWSRTDGVAEPMGASNWAIVQLDATTLAEAVKFSGVDTVDPAKLSVFNVGNTVVAAGTTGMVSSKNGSNLMPKLMAMYDDYPNLYVYSCDDLVNWSHTFTFTSNMGWSLYPDPRTSSKNNTRQDEDSQAEKSWSADVSFFDSGMFYAGGGKFLIPRSYRKPYEGSGRPDKRPSANSPIILSSFLLESGHVKDDLYYGVMPMTLWETREVKFDYSSSIYNGFFYDWDVTFHLADVSLEISDHVYLGRRIWKDFLRGFMFYGMYGWADPVLDFTVHVRTWGIDNFPSLRARGLISDHITTAWGRWAVGKRYLRAMYWDPQCPESGRVCSGGSNNYWKTYVKHIDGDFDECRKWQDSTITYPCLLPIWGYECDRMTSAYKIYGEALCSHDQGRYDFQCEEFHNYWVNGGPDGLEPLCIHRRGYSSWFGPQPWVNFRDTWDDGTERHSTGSCPSPGMLNQGNPHPRPTFSNYPGLLEFWQVWNFKIYVTGFSYHLYPNSDYGNQHYKSIEWYRGDTNGTNGAYSVYSYPQGTAISYDGAKDEITGEPLLKRAVDIFLEEMKGNDEWNSPPGVLTAKDVEEYNGQGGMGYMYYDNPSPTEKKIRYWSNTTQSHPYWETDAPDPTATCYFTVGAVFYIHCKAQVENGVLVPSPNGVLFIERHRSDDGAWGKNWANQDWLVPNNKCFTTPYSFPGPFNAFSDDLGYIYGNGGQIDVQAVMGDGRLLVTYSRLAKNGTVYTGYGLWNIESNILTFLGKLAPGGTVGSRTMKTTIDNYYRWGRITEGQSEVDVYMPSGLNTNITPTTALRVIKGDGKSYSALGTSQIGDKMPMRPGYRGLQDLKTQIYSTSPRPKIFITKPGELATVATRSVAGYADSADEVKSMLVSTSTIAQGGSYGTNGRHSSACASYVGGVYCRVLFAPPLRSTTMLAFDFPCSIVKVLAVEFYNRPIRPEQSSLQTPEQAAMPDPTIQWEAWVANQEHYYFENNVIGFQNRILPSLNGYVLAEFISTPEVLQVHHLWYWGLYGSQIGYFYPTWEEISKGNGQFYVPKIEGLVVPRYFLGTMSKDRYPDETPVELDQPTIPQQTYPGGTALSWITPADNPDAKEYGEIEWAIPRATNLDCGL